MALFDAHNTCSTTWCISNVETPRKYDQRVANKRSVSLSTSHQMTFVMHGFLVGAILLGWRNQRTGSAYKAACGALDKKYLLAIWGSEAPGAGLLNTQFVRSSGVSSTQPTADAGEHSAACFRTSFIICTGSEFNHLCRTENRETQWRASWISHTSIV